MSKIPPAGKRKRSIGDQIRATATLNQITERQKKLAEQARQRKKLGFTAKLKDVNRALDLAEGWGEEEQLVHRACWLKGLEYYENFASKGGPSPFAEADFVRRPGDELRPQEPPFVPQRVVPQGAPLGPAPKSGSSRSIAADVPPPSRVVAIEEVEAVHAQPVRMGNRTVTMRGLLPSGATDTQYQQEQPEFVERPGFIHEDVPQETQDEVPQGTVAEPEVDFSAAIVTEIPPAHDAAIQHQGGDAHDTGRAGSRNAETSAISPGNVTVAAAAPSNAATEKPRHGGGRPRLPRCAECGQTEKGGEHDEEHGGHEFLVRVA